MTRGFVHNGHIDRMPLGDLAETVIYPGYQCNPDIDFVYDRVIDGGRSHRCDTREFRAGARGTSPSTSPEVIVSLSGSISEIENDTHGGQ